MQRGLRRQPHLAPYLVGHKCVDQRAHIHSAIGDDDVAMADDERGAARRRDAMMAQHKANHIQVAYAKDAASADEAMMARSACFEAMGMAVSLCGVTGQ